MNEKYFGRYLIGLGVFGSVLGNVASAEPPSDEDWAKYEEKLNDARKVEGVESFIKKFLSYLSVFAWWNYYKDCKVKEYTDKNIAISREILGIFKGTFGLEALDDCKLTFANNTNVSVEYVNDCDQIFSLQKEKKLLNALSKLFAKKEKLDNYVISSSLGNDPKKSGGVFEELGTLLDDSIRTADVRRPFLNKKVIGTDVLSDCWGRLRNFNSCFKYTSSNVAIAKKIFDVLKDDFQIGKGADWYLSQDGAKQSMFTGKTDPLLCAEEYLVRCMGTLFESLDDLIREGYKAPKRFLDGGVDEFRKKIGELKKLMFIAFDNAKNRCNSNVGNSYHSAFVCKCWNDCAGDVSDVTRRNNITVFSERYVQKCFVPDPQQSVGVQMA